MIVIYILSFLLVACISFSMYSTAFAIKVSALMALFCLMHIVFDKLKKNKNA